jgi:dolichol-phosphate mannosyltransferase
METVKEEQTVRKQASHSTPMPALQNQLLLKSILGAQPSLFFDLGVQTKKICVLIPCHNEERGIGNILDMIPALSFIKSFYDIMVLVVDNNCIDKTAAIAESKGAVVIHESRQGKGHAVKTGFQLVPDDADYVVMIDGDGTYDISEIFRLIEPLEKNFADVVVGSRLNGRMDQGSMGNLNRVGNWLFTFLVRVAYQTNVTDVCSGFFAWKRGVVQKLSQHLESDGFSLEMEMITKLAHLHYECCSVPISYHPRAGHSNLRPIRDGISIMRTWLKNLWWKPRISQPDVSGMGSYFPLFHS